MLEDAPVGAQPGAGQLRFDQGVIVSAVEAALALAEAADKAVHVPYRAFSVQDGEEHGFVEQMAEVDVVFEADQFQLQFKGCADALAEFERHHFECSFANECLKAVAQIRLARHKRSLSAV